MLDDETRVAFQGVPGAYSEQAIRQHFGPGVASLPSHSFGDIFAAVGDGRASHGMVPIENSLAGTVIPAYDALLASDLSVQAEVILAVNHCLLAPAGTALGDIHRAVSHPQALAQCRDTLRSLGIEPVAGNDTAGSARWLAENPDPGTAAIASALAGELYGLETLLANCQDVPANFTRFFVVGHGAGERRDPSKTSLVFATEHRPGALYAVLGELARRDLNLTKLESRPQRDRAWHYLFYVDFQGHVEDSAVREALAGIAGHTTHLRVLGAYPAAPTAV